MAGKIRYLKFCVLSGGAAIALSIIFSIFASATSAQADVAEIKDSSSSTVYVTLAIFDFSDSGANASGIGHAVAEMLIGKLSADPAIRIFERGRLKEIMEEQKHSYPSDMEGNAFRAGRIAGVRYALLGKISEFGVNDNSILIPGQGNVTKYKARAALDIRLVSTADAMVIKTWHAVGSDSSFNLGINILGLPNFSFSGSQFDNSLLGKATRKAVDSAAKEITDYLNDGEFQEAARNAGIVGIIADVESNTLIINIGSDVGVQPGQLFIISRTTKQVRDPESGELLTEKKKNIGAARVTSVNEKFSEAVSEMDEGQVPQTGDLVTLVAER